MTRDPNSATLPSMATNKTTKAKKTTTKRTVKAKAATTASTES